MEFKEKKLPWRILKNWTLSPKISWKPVEAGFYFVKLKIRKKETEKVHEKILSQILVERIIYLEIPSNFSLNQTLHLELICESSIQYDQIGICFLSP